VIEDRNLVLATAPTQLSAVHKAAPLGGVQTSYTFSAPR
jgi:hypothetical protein